MTLHVSFYQLMHTPVEKVLPRLLDKIYQSNQRVVVGVSDDDRLKSLNTTLWTYSTQAFLPHGCSLDCDDVREEQPIWLSTQIENPNHATVYVATHESTIDKAQSYGFDRIVDIYDHTLEVNQKRFLDRLQFYKNQKATVVIWQQTKDGWKPGNEQK